MHPLGRNVITPLNSNLSKADSGSPDKGVSRGAAESTNAHQIHQLVTAGDEVNTIVYEYEIVNRDHEAKWANRQARRYGLCMTSRLFFLLFVNTALVALTCSTCAILLYVNTPYDLTYQPLTFGQSCLKDSASCDSLRFLTCAESVCACSSNRAWNGTDCVCATNQYWDGLACLTSQGYQQACSPNADWLLPCYSTFTCDSLTSTCLCASSSASYYTQFYTGAYTDLYGNQGGYCTNKYSYGVGCGMYGVAACQEYLGLTCAVGPTTVIQCICYSGYFWNSTGCQSQLLSYGASCATNQWGACNKNVSLYCDTTTWTCSCAANYYWNYFSLQCMPAGGYQAYCALNSWCNSSISLQCYLGGAPCNCPTASTYNKCDCPASMYWDGQLCALRVAVGSPCAYPSACASGNCFFSQCY